ncbi:MAG: hypothetical protein MJ244_05160 [Clostridia bacterium]|nr:hypothetical protein [Clostridia bacterium]
MNENMETTEKQEIEKVSDFKQRAEYLKSLTKDGRKWHLLKVNSNDIYTVHINDNNVFTTEQLKAFVASL